MAVALLFAHAPQAVALQGGEEGPLPAVNYLEIFCCRVPSSKQDRARLPLLLVARVDQPLLAMGSLGLAINGGRIPAIVNWLNRFLLAPTVHQTHDPTPPHAPMLIATVLGTDQVNEPGVAFVMHAVLHTQTRLLTIFYPVFDQLPHLSRHEPLVVQTISAHVVAHVFQGLGQVRTRTVLRRAHQIRAVLLLGNHACKMLFFALKRKS
jgi:hypothetical protein